MDDKKEIIEEVEDSDNETFTYTVDNNNLRNDYNKNNFDEKKSFIYILVGFCILVFIIVLLVIFANKNNSKNAEYTDIESKMVSGAKKYYDKYKDKLPVLDGDNVSISVDTLVENSFLVPLSEMTDGKSCSGYVKVYKNGEDFSYFPYLNCGEEYESSVLSKKIIDSGVVTSGEGLYKVNDEYFFRGEYPNNFVKFDDQLWRILRINSDGSIKLLYVDKKKEKNVWDDRYNSDKDNYVGINNFRVSRLLEYLNKVYDNNTFVSKNNKKYLVKHNWCIGKVSENDISYSNLNLCSDVYSDLYIGVVQLDDLLIPSIDPKCVNLYDNECTNYNYLYSYNIGWTLNASTDRSSIAFSSNNGEIVTKTTSYEGHIKPVVNINGNVLYKSGSGTEKSPYVIGD